MTPGAKSRTCETKEPPSREENGKRMSESEKTEAEKESEKDESGVREREPNEKKER